MVNASLTDEQMAFIDSVLRYLGFCTVCADGSTMPCTECGAGL